MYQTEKPVYMAGIYRTWEMEHTGRFILNKGEDENNVNVQTPSDSYDLRGFSEDEMADKIASIIEKDLGWNT